MPNRLLSVNELRNTVKVIIHQTHHRIGAFREIFSYLKESILQHQEGIHLYPENFLTGYPLQDLCLQKSFFNAYLKELNKFKSWFKQIDMPAREAHLVGGLAYDLTKEGNPLSIKNVIFEFSSLNSCKAIYAKRLLPNYDIFDEKKYFTKGTEPGLLEIDGKTFGLLICEDMWPSTFYDLDPVNDLYLLTQKENIELSGILNLSASPYHVHKHQSRLERAQEISHLFQCPFYYVNRVGGEDEILFDGGSFAVDGATLIGQAPHFEAANLELINPTEKANYIPIHEQKTAFTWEELFHPHLNESSPPQIDAWTDMQCASVLEALKFGFQEYATRNGFKKFSIALSGGMDSALALSIIKLSLREDQMVEAIYMPSIHSAGLSYDLSYDLCQNLNVPFKTMPIKFLHSTAKNLFSQTFNEPFEGLTDENIQSRMRGLLIYTRSNQIGSMVVNTSNKSELAVGYSTQYGDSVGAISLLGDLYKSQVYHLARYINRRFENIIPAGIIERPPSAELRPDQKDTDSLPPYDCLDAILEGILSYRHDKNSLIDLGFEPEDVSRVLDLYRRSEYKRYQFCPIIKIHSKSFGFGYRIPLTKDSKFYS